MSEKLVQIRYLTTARGPNYRHDEGQVAEVDLAEARALIAAEIAEPVKLDGQGRWIRVDLAELEREAEPPKASEPETADHPPAEKAVAPPQQRVGPRRRPADHEARPSKG